MATPVAVLKSTNPGKIKDVNLFPETTTLAIGRGANCEVQLTDPRCSTRHCTIIQKRSDSGVSFLVEDQSTNGTYVNQQLVRTKQLGKGSVRQLNPGDELAILRSLAVGHEQHLAFIFELVKKRKSPDSGDEVMKKPKLDLAKLQVMCQICDDVIRECTTLSPCLHNVLLTQFCASCYAPWREQSDTCPLCRKLVQSVHQNPLIDEHIQGLVSRQDSGKLSQSFNSLGSAEDLMVNENGKSKLVHSTKLMYPGCEQCREMRDGFQCPTGQVHVLCRECKAAMPLRLSCAQQCLLCEGYFCNLYLRSSKCVGVMCTQIQPINAYVRTTFCAVLPNALYDNLFEQTVLQDYLRLQKLPINFVAEQLVQQMETQKWALSIGGRSEKLLRHDSFVCADCAKLLWNELLLRYRGEIERDLPDYLQKRERCRYGAQCRTQKHNISHAQKFSHLCQRN